MGEPGGEDKTEPRSGLVCDNLTALIVLFGECVRVRACVRACVRVCVCVCVSGIVKPEAVLV